MPDILALADARLALRLPAGDIAINADLQATYIPAVTPIVEDIVGPVITAAGRTLTVDGGQDTILLPSAIKSVESVVVNGTPLTEGTGYTVARAYGWIACGAPNSSGSTFPTGSQNIVITYTAGPYATSADVPARYKLGARIILAHLVRADEIGDRPQFGSDDDMVMTPSGFMVPRRAYELLTGGVTIAGMA